MQSPDRNPRVLVIDDNPAIHTDIRKILCPAVSEAASTVADLEAQILGDAPAPVARLDFQVDSAYQGREGLALVEKAIAVGLPYAMAFVDIRMPPGWDGVETTLELWKVAPDIQIVICTAYSDYSWDEMLAKIGGTDRLVILKKPFDTIEVLQLANSLTEKSRLQRETRIYAEELEARVEARTADLRATNQALQEEIARRAKVEADLQRAKEAAESADRAKSAFVANMSHEIRTPMNGVVGMANLLLNSPLNAEQKDFAEVLCRSCDALLTIINDILDFSKIEAGSLDLEKIDFDLVDNLGLAIDLHAEAAAQKSVELVLDIDAKAPRFVTGDPTRLRQIVLNLLGNAIKFTSRGDVVITVSVDQFRPPDVVLRFEIRDTGIGIPPAVQERLFQPFVQGDASTTRKFGGTGLGLAICKRLVELMGGSIGVRSEPGSGSTFWFTISLGHPLMDSTPAQPEPTPISGCRALVVDDNAANRKLMRHLFVPWGLQHGEAEDAEQALAELRRAAVAGQPYDLALLDFHMPGMDGLGLAAAIRADTQLPQPQMVLLTSSGERLALPDLARHGLAACELKPLHADKLRVTLSRVLRSNPSAARRVETGPTGSVEGGPPAAILVAEDNAVNQKVTLLQLRQLGHRADIASNGREVLSAMANRTYDLILMDAQMPELDGIETTRLIRETEKRTGASAIVPIIAMTASAMECDRTACLAAGMDDFLPKPVRPHALRSMLERYLPRRNRSAVSAAAG
jgi:signal transduction histidine kinase/PleD family two-component response regulator